MGMEPSKSSSSNSEQRGLLFSSFPRKLIFGIVLIATFVITFKYEIFTDNIKLLEVALPATNNSETNNTKYLVPNYAHFTWYTEKPKELQFHHLLSLLSVHRIMKPEKIFFHCDMEPIGKYWEEAKREIPYIKIVPTKPPKEVFGVTLKAAATDVSHSDADRLRIILEYGGMYLDLDVIILKPIEPLRVYQTTLGFEKPGYICGGIIISAPKAPFMYLWIYAMLHDYQVKRWAYISNNIPSKLVNEHNYSSIVHIETGSMHYPNWEQLHKLIGPEIYDWSTSYSVHLWIRLWERQGKWKEWQFKPDAETIKKLNNTFGQIARYVYYGSKEFL